MRHARYALLLVVVLYSSGSAAAQPAELPPPAAAKKAPVPKAPKPPKKEAKGGKRADLAPDIAALSGADTEMAIKAAEMLGRADEPAAHDALLDALAFGLPARVAITAVGALTLHPAPTDVAALKRYAGHHTPTVRSAAVTALSAYPDPAARGAIVAALHDPSGAVRAAAAGAAGKGRVRDAVESLLKLLAKGEEASARALAQLADTDLARKIADHYGKVPDASLALTLGLILKRQDFGPDPAKVEIVRAMAKIQDAAAVNQLKDYVDTTPKTPPKPSRQEAQMVIEARVGGGGK
ncbi:MAG: HEAT repeat domain-containing protein [Deltaproteobacteria bacterium]|nr:HEAT repeat domain-containing protein [Deltaproteobacteria bacterium]